MILFFFYLLKFKLLRKKGNLKNCNKNNKIKDNKIRTDEHVSYITKKKQQENKQGIKAKRILLNWKSTSTTNLPNLPVPLKIKTIHHIVYFFEKKKNMYSCNIW
jgi:5-methylcytosine-specific restriction endonuclease McrA